MSFLNLCDQPLCLQTVVSQQLEKSSNWATRLRTSPTLCQGGFARFVKAAQQTGPAHVSSRFLYPVSGLASSRPASCRARRHRRRNQSRPASSETAPGQYHRAIPAARAGSGTRCQPRLCIRHQTPHFLFSSAMSALVFTSTSRKQVRQNRPGICERLTRIRDIETFFAFDDGTITAACTGILFQRPPPLGPPVAPLINEGILFFDILKSFHLPR